MPSDQISFTDVEYSKRRRVSRREQFLDTMDAATPWSRWVGQIKRAFSIEPFCYSGHRGRKLLESQGEIFEEQGWIMRGGSIVDATIIAAPSSTKNAAGARDPEMLWR